jgi:hypothetical protein
LARATKNNEKKGRPLKFFIHRSKLQAGTSDDDGHRESQLIGAVTRPRPTSACSGQLALQKPAKTAGVQREEAETRTGICVLSFLFFIARANQKIPNLALGRQSKSFCLF